MCYHVIRILSMKGSHLISIKNYFRLNFTNLRHLIEVALNLILIIKKIWCEYQARLVLAYPKSKTRHLGLLVGPKTPYPEPISYVGTRARDPGFQRWDLGNESRDPKVGTEPDIRPLKWGQGPTTLFKGRTQDPELWPQSTRNNNFLLHDVSQQKDLLFVSKDFSFTFLIFFRPIIPGLSKLWN